MHRQCATCQLDDFARKRAEAGCRKSISTVGSAGPTVISFTAGGEASCLEVAHNHLQPGTAPGPATNFGVSPLARHGERCLDQCARCYGRPVDTCPESSSPHDPRHKGGHGRRDNLEVLCPNCHRRKTIGDVLTQPPKPELTPISSVAVLPCHGELDPADATVAPQSASPAEMPTPSRGTGTSLINTG